MQAARGTSVDHHEDGSGRTGSGFLARPRTWLLFVGVAAVMVAIDQVAKVLAVRHLTDEPDVEVVGELLQLHLTYNPGAAFSLGTRFTVAIACLACAATLVVLWVSRRVTNKVWAVGLGLLLAGIDGNLIDRMLREPGPFRGHVVDFLMLPNWPVFNVADICINVGVGLILVQVLRGVNLDGSRVESRSSEQAGPEEAEGEQ
ncbi:signal peptidase II [Nocardioides carbamazepini]|uniref:signal peptidase II n=1 Tax=Nocardioides carbamazepini TaxID=2854259 RepID=UPI002149B975|nr:signal peptidase II [Nocardioides carbamazepini]MCR1781611.1 signal peptidase II [Nocardioides carbamazepini]